MKNKEGGRRDEKGNEKKVAESVRQLGMWAQTNNSHHSYLNLLKFKNTRERERETVFTLS